MSSWVTKFDDVASALCSTFQKVDKIYQMKLKLVFSEKQIVFVKTLRAK